MQYLLNLRAVQNAQLKIDDEPKKLPGIGFKVFKPNNFNLGQSHPGYDNLQASLLYSFSNYVDGLSELDVVC